MATKKKSRYRDYYQKECTKVDARTFSGVKEQVLKFLEDPKCPPDAKIMFATFLFKKIYLVYKFRYEDEKKRLCQHTYEAITKTQDLVLKGEYLQYLDADASTITCLNFYLNRYTDKDKYFILQLLNDVQLVKGYLQSSTISDSDLKEHFLSWIESSDVNEQQSNILDVLLRYYHGDNRVKAVYEKMRFRGKKNTGVYDDEQNVHDTEISAEVEKAANQLAVWGIDNPIELKYPVTPKTWTEGKLYPRYSSDKHHIVKAIIERSSIDTTSFGTGYTIFDTLFVTVRFIESLPDPEQRSSVYEVLLEEMDAAKELCASGYIGRFLTALQGQPGAEDFQYVLPLSKKLYAVLSSKIFASLQKAPEEVSLGTTYPEHRPAYVAHVCKVVNAALPELIADEGVADIRKSIVDVMKKLSDLSIEWVMKDDNTLDASFSTQT